MVDEISVVKVVLQNTDGEVLVVRDEDSGAWELPGGIIEEGEDRVEAARREVREETGYTVSGLEDMVRLELEDDRIVNCYVMYASEFSGDPAVGGDVTAATWVEPAEYQRMDWHRDAAYNIVPLMYIDEYREKKNAYGEGKTIQVVKCLIQNEDGKFLAMQKTPEEKIHSGYTYTLYGRMAGKWELPGGRFKDANDRFTAAKREIQEECGIEIRNLQDVVREATEERNTVDAFILYTDDWDGDVELSKEHRDYTWVTPDEYLSMDWHQDAGYGYPPMAFLDDYLAVEKDY